MDLSISEISFNRENELQINYIIRSLFSLKESLVFKVLDSDGKIISENGLEVKVKNSEDYNGEAISDISGAKQGMLKISVSNGEGPLLVEESVVYGGKKGITGFVFFDRLGVKPYVGISAAVLSLLIIWVGWRIWKLKRGAKKKMKKKKGKKR